MKQQQNGGAIGKRIRALRGDDTQANFAKKIGVTRSALANYETGRTVPNDMVILKIANVTGVDPSSINSGEAYTFDDLAALLGAKHNVSGMGDLTQDERAVIRLLRVCDQQAVLEVVGAILEGLRSERIDLSIIDAANFESDYVLLAKIKADGGRYFKGYTRDTLLTILDQLDHLVAADDGS